MDSAFCFGKEFVFHGYTLTPEIPLRGFFFFAPLYTEHPFRDHLLSSALN